MPMHLEDEVQECEQSGRSPGSAGQGVVIAPSRSTDESASAISKWQRPRQWPNADKKSSGAECAMTRGGSIREDRRRAWMINGIKRLAGCRLLGILLLLAWAPESGSVSLRPVGTGGNCLGEPWGLQGPCRILSHQGIPTVTVGLYASDGSPCCGGTSTTIEVSLARSDNAAAQIPMTGFAVKDSIASDEPGAAMVLDFSGLKTAHAVVGMFNLTFFAFFNGELLEYQTMLHIIPDSLRVRSVSLGTHVLHEVLPAMYIELVGRNKTILQGSGQRVHVRLFDKADMSDISASSLRGTTSVDVDSTGTAIFTDLSAQRTAGSGFRLAFFAEGSQKRCTDGMVSRDCSDLEDRRGKSGGIGGYWSEVLGPAMTLLPDKMRLTAQFLSLDSVVKVDKSLPVYAISVYDSEYPDVLLDGVVAEDNLEISVALISRSERYPVQEAHFEGTRSVAIEKGVAKFQDLVVRNTSGPAFGLFFAASWNDFCKMGNLDPACSGRCCVYSLDFPIYPYAMRLAPVALHDMVAGDNIT